VGNGEWGVGEPPSVANAPLPNPDLPIPRFKTSRRRPSRIPASSGSQQRGVGNGEWGVGEPPSVANAPLPNPDLPIPRFKTWRDTRMEMSR
jgi:hypothetical protein